MGERLAKVIDMSTRREVLSPEKRAHLIQRATDLAIQESLLKSEREQIERRLGEQA